MLSKISIYATLVIISLALASCNASGTKTATVSTSPATATVTVTEKDDGTTVELNRGDTLTVELAGNPTTGYQWRRIEDGTNILRQVGEPEFKPDSSAIGSLGKVVLRFEAVGSGRQQLQLAYQRSFEPQAPAAQTFKINVSVD